MNPALLPALLGAAATLVVLLCVLLAVALAGRRRTERALAAARTDVDDLRARLDALTEEVETARTANAATPAVLPAEYLITTAGQPAEAAAEGERDAGLEPVPARAVWSVTLGEPLLKAVAFGYGVRRALSPESRNRIAFEMRREVKRARKERRRAARRPAGTVDPQDEAA